MRFYCYHDMSEWLGKGGDIVVPTGAQFVIRVDCTVWQVLAVSLTVRLMMAPSVPHLKRKE